MLDRRHFLSSLAGIGALAAFRSDAFAESCAAAPEMPSAALYNQNEDAYWAAWREQFVIPKDEVYLNNGTVGSSPMPVLKAVFDGFLETEKMAQTDPEEYPIWGYEPYIAFREAVAQFVGATREQIALTRN